MAEEATVKPPIELTAAQARTVLKANRANIPKHTAALLSKVARNKPLTDRERGLLEGVIVNAERKRREGQNGTKRRAGADRMGRTERDFAVAVRRRRVLECRMRMLPVRDIAAELGIDKKTVCADLKALEKEFAAFAPTENRALLAQQIAQMDILIGENTAMAAKFTAPSAKAAFLRNAAQAMQDKTRLLENVGVIKVVPKVIHAAGPNDGPIPIETTAKIVLLPALEEGKQ
jgi:hypothetical protein